MDSLQHLDKYEAEGIIDSKLAHLFRMFYQCYVEQTGKNNPDTQAIEKLFLRLLECTRDAIQHPYPFEIYHQSIREPFDYYKFGLEFIRPLIDFSKSLFLGKENVLLIEKQLENKENIILLANHQTEPDPQIISLFLEENFPNLAAEMIFIAGHRVIQDPIAIPMSMGRNLLCIYSKKHISHVPEEKAKKMLHNQRTMKRMGELLNEGGVCIYVAPSGGRDRPNSSGVVEMSPFDPQSIELFWLLASHAKQPTHFYPLALKTYDLMPPPSKIEKDLGEKREVNFAPVFLGLGNEIDMRQFPGSENLDKKHLRNARCEYIWNLVNRLYLKLGI